MEKRNFIVMMTEELRMEIADSVQMDDKAAREIIENKLFKCDETENMTIQDIIDISDRIFFKIRSKLGILTPLIEDEEITEIMVNSPEEIFFEKKGKIYRYRLTFDSEGELEEVMQTIAAQVHREINELNPIVDARLKNGSRVNGVYKNIAIKGPTLTIRKFSDKYMSMDELVKNGTLNNEAAKLLEKMVAERYNIFVSGGTSSGKTTLLNALSQFIGRNERVIVIEDSAELQLNYIENLVQLECRQANAMGRGKVDMTELIKSSLRMRPDRIIVGEVRGAEVLQMIQAMNTGHSGSMSTGHGNSVEGMLKRLETMYLMATPMSVDAVREQIAEAIDVLVHIERQGGKRQITEITRLLGYENGKFQLKKLMIRDRDGLQSVGTV